MQDDGGTPREILFVSKEGMRAALTQDDEPRFLESTNKSVACDLKAGRSRSDFNLPDQDVG